MNILFKKGLIKMNYLTNILTIFVLSYFVILISTYIFQRNLLYHPKINNYHGHKLKDLKIVHWAIVPLPFDYSQQKAEL